MHSATPVHSTLDPQAARLIPLDAVRVQMDQPVLVDQADPSVDEWGRYRMPKLSWLPDGDICLTHQMGRDHFCDQGMVSPVFRSGDHGRSWRRAAWPHAGIGGICPTISRVHDGDFYCLPAGVGIELDAAQLPPPILPEDGSHPSSDGYTSLLALDPESFLVAYGDRHLVNADGKPCKSILAWRIQLVPA